MLALPENRQPKPRKYPSSRGWITLKEAAELTGLTPNRVAQLVRLSSMDKVLNERVGTEQKGARVS